MTVSLKFWNSCFLNTCSTYAIVLIVEAVVMVVNSPFVLNRLLNSSISSTCSLLMLMTCGREEVRWWDFSLYPVDGEAQEQSFLCKNHQCFCSNVWVLCKEHKIISKAQVHQVKVEVDAEVCAVLKRVCEHFVNSDSEETGGSDRSLTNSWGRGKGVRSITFGLTLQ